MGGKERETETGYDVDAFHTRMKKIHMVIRDRFTSRFRENKSCYIAAVCNYVGMELSCK